MKELPPVPRGVPRGEDVGGAILTADRVREIRARHVPYKVPARELAEEYGVSHWTIEAVLARRLWKHVI